MFSFFKTKKPSPPSSPDPIPSASNDFEIINPAPGGSDPRPNIAPYPNLGPYPYPVYPTFDRSGNQPLYPPALPNLPNLPNAPHRPVLQHSDSVYGSGYLSGVPFKLSPLLSTGDSEEILQIQVDDILASITSKMYISQLDYDFSLERSILQQTAPAESEAEPEAAPADDE